MASQRLIGYHKASHGITRIQTGLKQHAVYHMVTRSIFYTFTRSLYKIVYISSPKLSRSPRIETESPSSPCRSSNIPRNEGTTQMKFFTVILAEFLAFSGETFGIFGTLLWLKRLCFALNNIFQGREGKICNLLSEFQNFQVGFSAKWILQIETLFHYHVLCGQ